jgi:hypothetical protein
MPSDPKATNIPCPVVGRKKKAARFGRSEPVPWGPPRAPVVKGNGHPIHRITSFDPNGENAKMVQEFKARPFDSLVYGFDRADRVRPGAATRKSSACGRGVICQS